MSNKTVKSKLKPPGCNNHEISLPLLSVLRRALLSQLIEKSVKLRQTKSKQKIQFYKSARQKWKFKTKNREQRFFRRKSKTWKNRQIKVIWTVKSERSTSVEFSVIQTIICLHSKWKWKVWGGGKRGQEKLTQRLHEIFEQNTFKDQGYRFIIFRKIFLLMLFYS